MNGSEEERQTKLEIRLEEQPGDYRAAQYSCPISLTLTKRGQWVLKLGWGRGNLSL